ncbi:MAG: hypothetical protein WC831_06240 [Parcubacteria group bacterium]
MTVKRGTLSNIRIGVLVQKCTCKDKKKCICGSHGPRFIDVEAHKQFVENIFATIDS